MLITASYYTNNKNRGKAYASVLHYVRPSRGNTSDDVEIYGLLSVNSDIDIPAQKIVKFAWDGIVDGFEYSNTQSFNESLKQSLQESTRRLKQIVVNDSGISEHGLDINFSVFVFNKKAVYIGVLGENDIFVYKNGKLVDITEMLLKKRAKTAGLVLEKEDILVSGTKSVIRRNLPKITGLQNKEEILERINGLEQNLSEEEAFVIFNNDKNIKSKERDDDIKIVQEPIHTEQMEKTTEVQETKHIHKSETKVPILNEISEEKDLKAFLSNVGNIFIKIWNKLREIAVSVWHFLSKKAGVLFSNIFLNLKEKIGHKRVFKQISAKVSQSNIGRFKDNGLKNLRVDGYKKRDKRFQRIKTVVLIVLGIGLVVFGIKFTMDQRQAMKIHKEADSVLTEAEDFVNKAESKAHTDKEGTETYIFKATNDLQSVPSGLNQRDQSRKDTLEARILGIEDDLYKRTGLSQDDGSIDTYIDTRLAFGEGSNASDIAIYKDSKNNEYLLVVDKSLKSVYRISLYNKEVKKLPDDNGVLQSPEFVYVGTSGLYVYDSKAGVVRASFDGDGWFKSFQSLTGLSVSSLDVQDVAEFAVLTDTDNVYVLDRGQNSLLKSSNVGSGYGLSFQYITDESLANANDVLADLSVYILTSGADGLRRYNYSYTEQKQVYSPVTVVGLNGDFKNLAYGYTQQSLNYGLYLFDSEDKRFMKFEKPIESGEGVRHANQEVLEKQYVYRGDREGVWDNVHDFVVNSDESSMYILDGSTIWKVRL